MCYYFTNNYNSCEALLMTPSAYSHSALQKRFVGSSVRAIAVVPLLWVVAACGGANMIGPTNALEVGNTTDTFQWQVSALENVTQTLSYSWHTTGITANVNQATELVSGTAVVRVTDGNGTQVYNRSLAENGTFETDVGVPGMWLIVVELTDVDGTLNFRVQTP